jgi:chemotaxis family two-component system response regulator Rcp1
MTPSSNLRHVLIVEDDEADLFLIQEAIDAKKLPIELHVVKDGEQAVRFFDQADRDTSAPCPALVVLDINLPKKQGSEVLKHMRGSPKCRHAFVIAVSTSDSMRDREQMKELGANGYFRKPSEYIEFMELGELVKGLLAGGAEDSH